VAKVRTEGRPLTAVDLIGDAGATLP
jgi:hypothetical protein